MAFWRSATRAGSAWASGASRARSARARAAASSRGASASARRSGEGLGGLGGGLAAFGVGVGPGGGVGQADGLGLERGGLGGDGQVAEGASAIRRRSSAACSRAVGVVARAAWLLRRPGLGGGLLLGGEGLGQVVGGHPAVGFCSSR